MEVNIENIVWATEQVQRMESLPGYPKTEAGLAEYAKVLLRMAEDKKCGEHVITVAVLEEERFPPPVFLREILERLGYWPADRPLLPGMPGYVTPSE